MSVAGTNVLYIDDDPALGRLIQRQLSRHGHEIHLAADGAAGLRRLAAGDIETVVLDHYMPGQDGLAILEQIVALADPPPVVFLTGTSESRIAVAALKAGAADYVVKDAGGDFVDLLDVAIRSAFERARLRREKEAAEREVREARDRFEALAAERHVLMREVNHRVGNSLQLVAAVLHMQASSSSSPETRAALHDANRRVLAIAQVHRRLYASDDVKSVPLGAYLEGLIDDLRQSADGGRIGDLLSLDADPLTISADAAVTIGIIVTELVINALKYAYPGGSGPIRVTLRAKDCPGRYVLTVEDEGVGRPGAAVASGGLGRTIIRAMAAKLDSVLDYEDAGPGTRARLVFALPREASGGALTGTWQVRPG